MDEEVKRNVKYFILSKWVVFRQVKPFCLAINGGSNYLRFAPARPVVGGFIWSQELPDLLG